MSNLISQSAVSLIKGLKEGQFSAEEYIFQILDRINAVDGRINAFVTTDAQGALQKARELDKKAKSGENLGKLAGLAIGIKDNICTRGLKTTCASKMLQNYVPAYDATVVQRMRQEDAIILGKMNLDEFGMGSTTEYSAYGPARNPWNLDYVTGGSSGGSAAAVAAMECTAALGSDTGGSIRCPSSFCSVVGLKPTYGTVSRFGLVPYANSFEQIGPICRNVSDVKLLMEVISGADENDNTSVPVNFQNSKSDRFFSAGIIREMIDGSDSKISKLIYRSCDLMNGEEYSFEETSIDNIDYALPSYYTIATAEASSNLSRYDNLRYGYDLDSSGYEWNRFFSSSRKLFGDEVKRRIMLGSFVLSAGYYGKYYLKAQKARSLIKKKIKDLFNKYDVLISPTMPILPFKIGEKVDDPLKMYMVDINTVIPNLTGIPSISIPVGFINDFPVGIQIMADEFHEEKLFSFALSLERKLQLERSPAL